MLTHEEVFELCNNIMSDISRCKVISNKDVIWQHGIDTMRMAIKLGICNESDLQTLAEAYPKGEDYGNQIRGPR